MLLRIFMSLQVKQCAIITYKHSIYEFPHELLNHLNIIFLFPTGKAGCQVMLLDQVEKVQIYLPFLTPFNTESTSQLLAEQELQRLRAVVRIEMSAEKRAITASSLSEEVKLFMWNRKSNGARTEP